MPWKKDAAGNLIVENGNPVHIDAKTNVEKAFDADKATETIGNLFGESRQHREKREEAEGKLKTFTDLGVDPAAAKTALETVAAFKGKQAIDAAELEKIRSDTAAAVESKYAPMVKENGTLKTQMKENTLSQAFAASKYVADKVAVPHDMLRSMFGNRFEVVDGKIVSKGADGREIASVQNPGQLASFDESLEIVISGYHGKNSILKGAGQSGGGAGGGGQNGGTGADGRPQMSRKAFDALDPAAKMTTVKTTTIVD